MRSVDELGPLFGTLVGVSLLRRAKLLVLRRSIIVLSREISWSSHVCKSQALLWALKSPMMIVLSRVFRFCLCPVGQQQTGKM